MRATGLKLTVFTTFTIAVTFWLASIIGNIHPFAETYAVKAVFQDATGVLVGDLVTVAGVEVGKVTGFEVTKGEAIVSLEIDDDVELPKNVIADLKFRNLLGQRTLDLVRPANPSDEVISDGGTIPVEQTRPALDITVVFNNLEPLIKSTNPEDINTVAEAVVEVFGGEESQLEGILQNVGDLTQTLAARDQRLARLVTDLNEVSKVLNRQGDNVRVSLDEFGEFMAALAEMTPQIEQTVAQLDAASEKFGGVVTRNRAHIDRDIEALADVLGVVNDNLGSLAAVSQNLKEVLLATARSQSYGRWWNLYVVNLCIEDVPSEAPALGCSL